MQLEVEPLGQMQSTLGSLGLAVRHIDRGPSRISLDLLDLLATGQLNLLTALSKKATKGDDGVDYSARATFLLTQQLYK